MAGVTELPFLAEDQDNEIGSYKANSLWRLTLRRLMRRKAAVIGLTILAFLLFVALFAEVIAPYHFTDDLLSAGAVRRGSPCIHLLGCPKEQTQFLMGTDANFRDVFSRLVYGTRISLAIGFFTVGIAILVGTTLGAICGYVGGWVDNLIMRLLDVILAFPFLLLAIAIVSVLGPGLVNAMLAIAIVSMPTYARVVRASVLSVREQAFVEASRALGASHFRILFLRILPNSLPPLIVQSTLGIGTAILDTAALSFIGLGAQPPMPEWGSMLASERNQVFSAPHLVFFPGLAIMLTVLAFTLLGDGLRDALDPRLAHAGVKSE